MCLEYVSLLLYSRERSPKREHVVKGRTGKTREGRMISEDYAGTDGTLVKLVELGRLKDGT
jgi:hypothetical protein